MIETKSNVTAKVLTTREEKQFKEIKFDSNNTENYKGKYLKYSNRKTLKIVAVKPYYSLNQVEFHLEDSSIIDFNVFNQKHFKFFEEIPSSEQKTVVLEMPLDIADKIKDKLGQTVYTEDTQVVYQALEECIRADKAKSMLGIKA